MLINHTDVTVRIHRENQHLKDRLSGYSFDYRPHFHARKAKNVTTIAVKTKSLMKEGRAEEDGNCTRMNLDNILFCKDRRICYNHVHIEKNVREKGRAPPTVHKYRLIRSNRKTIGLYITKDAAVEVRAPLKAPKEEIDRFVASKDEWIERHLSNKKRALKAKAAFEIDYGSILPLQGKNYPIVMKPGVRSSFHGECFFLPPGLSPEEIKRAILRLYRMIAKDLLTKKTSEWAVRLNVLPASVKVNDAKTHWGSCSSQNRINFSWRLIMADDDVIDYVVVHELAHIKEHNHSNRLWSIVAAALPDYLLRKKKLKAFQARLAREDWD